VHLHSGRNRSRDSSVALIPLVDPTPLLFAFPWLALMLFAVLVARFPSELPDASQTVDDDRLPSVSIVVPARDEALNIVSCLRSLVDSDYPDFEVIVVDDRSTDDTAGLARSVHRGNATRVMVVEGEVLPDGWLGKPWACGQGARVASGSLLLFTDADTTHGPTLLRRAVVGLHDERADLLTLVGRQLMESFWERLVQPQIFFMMLLRFPDFERAARNGRWRDAVANGQYLLFPRESYDRLGGHEVVKDEVVEDMALAQHVKRAGMRLRIRSAESGLSTRMYRSLPDLVEGWSKNIVTGGQQSLPRGLRSIAAPVSFFAGVLLWLVAPAVLLLWLAGGHVAFGGVDLAVGGQDVMTEAARIGFDAPVLIWAAAVYALSAAHWAWFSRRMGTSAWYGLLYPLGAAVGAWIFLRSWRRGRTVVWKGREYELPPVHERA
jgi:chlorobactene glucosyltransferase